MVSKVPLDETAVANGALSLVEHHVHLDSLSDGTVEAQACLYHFYTVRRQVLKAANWHFAKDLHVLPSTLDGELATEDLAYVYQLSGDVLRVISMPDRIKPRWRVMERRRQLHTDQEPELKILAIADVEDMTVWDDDAVGLFKLLLAAHLAPRFSRSQNRRRLLMEDYAASLEEARRTIALENSTDPLHSISGQEWTETVANPYCRPQGPGWAW